MSVHYAQYFYTGFVYHTCCAYCANDIVSSFNELYLDQIWRLPLINDSNVGKLFSLIHVLIWFVLGSEEVTVYSFFFLNHLSCSLHYVIPTPYNYEKQTSYPQQNHTEKENGDKASLYLFLLREYCFKLFLYHLCDAHSSYEFWMFQKEYILLWSQSVLCAFFSLMVHCTRDSNVNTSANLSLWRSVLCFNEI